MYNYLHLLICHIYSPLFFPLKCHPSYLTIISCSGTRSNAPNSQNQERAHGSAQSWIWGGVWGPSRMMGNCQLPLILLRLGGRDLLSPALPKMGACCSGKVSPKWGPGPHLPEQQSSHHQGKELPIGSSVQHQRVKDEGGWMFKATLPYPKQLGQMAPLPCPQVQFQACLA